MIHIEQVWPDNFWTAEGNLLHGRVDGGAPEQRGNLRTERSVAVISHRLRITGKLDLLEIQGKSSRHYFPVEYKRGKPKVKDWDRVQLCAQALCLEEMRSVKIEEGALWYWQERRRETVVTDKELRLRTKEIIIAAQAMIQSGITPHAVFDKRCKACSLIDLCEPKILQRDRSSIYLNEMFSS